MAEVLWTDRFAAPLDGVRRAALSRAFASTSVRRFFSSRDRRVAWIVGAHACLALALTVLFPAPLLVLLPLVLGVPHVVADVRYLVLRSAIGSRARASILVGSSALVGVNALALLGVRFDAARAEVALGTLVVVATAVVALGSALRTPSRARSVLGSFVVGVLAFLGWRAAESPRVALVVLIHAHNVIALVVWLWLFRNRLRGMLLPLTLVMGAASLLISGTFIPATLRLGVWSGFGTNLLAAADWLAPGLPDALGVGVAASFIFLQSVHYLVWLVLVPTDGRPGPGFVSFKRSFRDFSRDLGAPAATAAVCAWLAFAGFGAVAPLATKNAYLALASFHVWLELAVLMFCALSGRALVPRTGGAG